jgi:CheY-like chemotaxis protein
MILMSERLVRQGREGSLVGLRGVQPGVPPDFMPDKLNVLMVVVDNRELALRMNQMLVYLGHSVCVVTTFDGAVESIANTAFDLLLVEMQRSTGAELIRRLRSAKATPAIGVTFSETGEEAIQTFIEGCRPSPPKALTVQELDCCIAEATIRNRTNTPCPSN